MPELRVRGFAVPWWLIFEWQMRVESLVSLRSLLPPLLVLGWRILRLVVLVAGRLGRTDTNPWKPLGMNRVFEGKITYHGSLTDQLRKMAARINKVISVTTAPPFWKNTPAMAGSKASPNGADCQCDSSCKSTSSPFDARGRNRSSVEDRIELRASDTESDNAELRRKLEKFEDSSAANVAARATALCLSPESPSFSLLPSLSGLDFMNEARGEGDDGRGCSVMLQRCLQDNKFDQIVLASQLRSEDEKN